MSFIVNENNIGAPKIRNNINAINLNSFKKNCDKNIVLFSIDPNIVDALNFFPSYFVPFFTLVHDFFSVLHPFYYKDSYI